MDDVFYWVETEKGIGIVIGKYRNFLLIYFPKENSFHNGQYFRNKPCVRGNHCWEFFKDCVDRIK